MSTKSICNLAIGGAVVLFLILLSVATDKDFVEFQLALASLNQIIATLLILSGVLGFLLAEFGRGPQPPVKSPFLAMLLVGATMLSHMAGLALVGLMAVRVWHDRSGGKPVEQKD